MRRFLALVGVLAGSASTALGQYPYPYGPMPYAPLPMPYMQPYGPMPMPRPVYYPPLPMQPALPAKNTNVFVYGPLTDDVARAPRPPMAAPAPYPLTAKAPTAGPAKPEETPAALKQTQATLTRGGHKSLPTYSKADLLYEDFGGPCDDHACAPAPARHMTEVPMRGKGHFIGEVGAYFLTPIGASRIASQTTANGVTTTEDFPRPTTYGARAAFGYIFHTGWGLRAGYEYLRDSASRGATNADPTVNVTTPIISGFQIASPSATLLQGVGADQFNFSQRLDLHAADVEIVKQGHFLDTTFLGGVGARYVSINQRYSATRTNAGGVSAAGTAFALDREDLDSSNRFEGWGPTVSLEVVHPLGCGFSAYGDVRGAFIWGIDRFSQSYRVQQRNTTAGGATTFTDNTQLVDSFSTRFAPILEAELGIQYGCRVGKCYLWARAGAVYQRWWDIGTPTAANGSLSFLGGTVRTGISY